MRKATPWVTLVLVLAALASACGDVRDENGTISRSGLLSVHDLRAGDCGFQPTDGEVEQIEVTPCDKEHDVEVMSVLSYDRGDEYDQASVEAFADQVCVEAFEEFVGLPYGESLHDVIKLTPNQESWYQEDLQDREVACLFVRANGEAAGSARGINE
ncbi:MAG: hypothetical protein JJLCMIEE_03153 [Acidimicrobiales bacterium]|nr:hypothetical protein [Acidimicrobiales bacterium]